MIIDLTPNQADETVNGDGLKRSELSIIKVSTDRWIVIDTTNNRVLCYGFKSFPFHIYLPFEFVTYSRAEEWIKSGSIGKLQEGWSTLDVGFHDNLISKYIPYGA